MKILVTVKRVIDYNVKIRVNNDQTNVDLTNIKMAINPFCEIAVEEAIRLKEKGVASEILVVSIGPKEASEQIRTALALGADRGLLIETSDSPSSLNVAKLLKAVIDEESPELVIMGKQSIDTDNNQTGQMLAALTARPQGTFISSLECKNNELEIVREVDKGLETLKLQLPAILTCDLRLNEPRYASLPNIMKAKRKPINVKTPDELGVKITQTVELIKVEPPPTRKAGIKVVNTQELVDKLKNEVKVI